MAEDITKSPLYKIANPQSIVVFGASSDPTSMGSIQLNALMDLGFKGKIYPVHPRDKIIMGLKAYASVQDLPEVPDLALIVVPTKIVGEILRYCGEKGIRHAIVVSGGFKELGEEGARLEEELKEIAKVYGIRFLGPNCIGVANPYARLNTTIFKYTAPPGYIGMASQSGSFVTQMFDYIKLFNMGFSTAFSVGNEADLDLVDCLQYFALCPHTKVITLYIEGIRRGRQFVEIAREVSLSKPIVAYYAGGTNTGKRAGLGHTGAVAGPEKLYEGAFKQAGIIKANNVQELFLIAWAFQNLPLPKGNRVVVLTHSGGPGAAAADACGRAGLEMPELNKELVEKLKNYLPSTANLKNPVDATFSKNMIVYYTELPQIILDHSTTDVLFYYSFMPQERVKAILKEMNIKEEQMEEMAKEILKEQTELIRSIMLKTQKPIMCFNFRDPRDPYVAALIERNIPVFSDPHLGAKAIKALLDYWVWRNNRKKGDGYEK